MAAPSTPAAIPQSSSTTPSPPASASPPSSNTNPPPKPATASPVPSPPPPPAATPPPTPSVVPPPPGSSSPPPNLHPPKPSLPPPTVPPTVPPPQPSPPPPHPSPSPPTVAPPQPSPPSPTVPPPKSSPPPSTVPPPKPSPPPSTVPPPKPSPPPPKSSPPPSTVPPPKPSPPPSTVPPPKPSPPPSTIPPPKPSPPPSTVPPPKPSPPTPKPSPPAQAPPPKVESPPPPDAKPPPSSTPPPTNPAEPSPSTYPTPAAANPDNSSKSIKTSSIVGITVGIAALVILMLLAALMIRFTKRRKKSQHVMPSSVKPPESYISQISGPTTSSASPVKTSSSSHELQYSSKGSGLSNSKPSFSYKELSAITNGFSPQNLLGKGGFGDVYKGRLVDGRDVAVKQLKVGGGQGEREFQAEVEIISRIHHRHLVSLVGYCTSENQRLLVFDYVPNNTLHYHLHEQGRPVMEWATRVRVAAGAARGIAYLHEDCHPRIIHRDIKSSNILLDDNFDAQVSDFGLAKFTVDAQTHVSTRVVGTFGYLAPEYAASGKLTDKSDVFSFGVVLLELVTGRKPVDASQPIGDESLVEWARPLMSSALESGDLGGLPDPKLAGNYDRDEMLRMIETAAVCVRHSALMRPRMAQVMRVLDDLTENKLDLQMGMRPGQSELFNSGPDSADVQLFHRMAFGGPDFSINFSEATRSSDQDL